MRGHNELSLSFWRSLRYLNIEQPFIGSVRMNIGSFYAQEGEDLYHHGHYACNACKMYNFW